MKSRKRKENRISNNKKIKFWGLGLFLIISVFAISNIIFAADYTEKIKDTITATNKEANHVFPLTDVTQAVVPSKMSGLCPVDAGWGQNTNETYQCYTGDGDICLNCEGDASCVETTAGKIEGDYKLPSYATVTGDGFVVSQPEVLDNQGNPGLVLKKMDGTLGLVSAKNYFYRYSTTDVKFLSNNDCKSINSYWSASYPKICHTGYTGLKTTGADNQFGTRDIKTSTNAYKRISILAGHDKNLYRAMVKYVPYTGGYDYNTLPSSNTAVPAIVSSFVVPSDMNGCVDPVFGASYPDNDDCEPWQTRVQTSTIGTSNTPADSAPTLGICQDKLPCGVDKESNITAKTGYAFVSAQERQGCSPAYLKVYKEADKDLFTKQMVSIQISESGANTRAVELPLQKCFTCKAINDTYCGEIVRDVVIATCNGGQPLTTTAVCDSPAKIDAAIRALATSPRDVNERLPQKLECASCLSLVEGLIKQYIP